MKIHDPSNSTLKTGSFLIGGCLCMLVLVASLSRIKRAAPAPTPKSADRRFAFKVKDFSPTWARYRFPTYHVEVDFPSNLAGGDDAESQTKGGWKTLPSFGAGDEDWACYISAYSKESLSRRGLRKNVEDFVQSHKAREDGANLKSFEMKEVVLDRRPVVCVDQKWTNGEESRTIFFMSDSLLVHIFSAWFSPDKQVELARIEKYIKFDPPTNSPTYT